jgi:DeoR family transcriptional regulator, myo-inositol catabolism operon repressor
MRRARIEDIKAYIAANRSVTTAQLCARFQISQSTLRRNLAELTRGDEIRKSYGVLTAHPATPRLPFEERHVANAAAKQRIAAVAATEVKDHDIIFIDSGTTTMYLVDHLRDRTGVTIVTNNLEVIRRAFPHDNLTVVTMSGVLNRELCSFSGGAAVSVLAGLNINHAFLATAGIARDLSVTNAFVGETELKKMAIARSVRRILLADASKFGVLSLCTYCRMDEIDIVVTDRAPGADYPARLAAAGTALITCAPGRAGDSV